MREDYNGPTVIRQDAGQRALVGITNTDDRSKGVRAVKPGRLPEAVFKLGYSI